MNTKLARVIVGQYSYLDLSTGVQALAYKIFKTNPGTKFLFEN